MKIPETKMKTARKIRLPGKGNLGLTEMMKAREVKWTMRGHARDEGVIPDHLLPPLREVEVHPLLN